MSENKNIWKSIKEYQEDPEVLKEKLDEFKEGVTDDFNPDEMNKFSRRKFLAVLAASTAYAATACTNYRDKGEIVPYVDRPEEILPGKPTYYASTFYDDGISYGVLIKTREGRPIKIEGNPDDEINRGKIPSKIHASILNLYDPERLKEPRIGNRKVSWNNINAEIIQKLDSSLTEGKEIVLITNPITSPSTNEVIDEFKNKFSNVKVYTTQIFNQNNRINAWEKSFGQKVIPSIKWNKANLILSLESDFLGREGNTAENRILYTQGRDVINTKSLNKLYSVEAGMSLTGMNSDVRFRLKPQQQFDLILTLLNELVKKNAVSISQLDSNIRSIVNSKSLTNFASENSLDLEKLNHLVIDLVENKGKSIVYAGDTLPIETHILVNLLNELLDNSKLYNFERAYLVDQTVSTSVEFKELVSKMNKGKVSAIIHFDSNPVYELAPTYQYKKAIKNVETVISLSETPNETTSVSHYVLPLNNILESWGYHQSRNGYISLQQPVISPLFNTRQKEAILLNWVTNNSETTEHQFFVKNSFKKYIYDQADFAADFDTFWLTALHDGIVKIKPKEFSNPNFKFASIEKSNLISTGLTVMLQNNYTIGTGKYANNGWLQELPHPVTKVTWDNYAALAPATAEKHNLENDDLIKVSVNGSEVELPAFVQPGMAEDTIIIELGYGRKDSGDVANEVGFNANLLLSSENNSQYIFGDASVTKTGEVYKLASTQEHHSLDDDFVKDFHRIRKIIQEGTLEKYKSNPQFLHEHKHDIFSITQPHEYNNEKWAMSIDLNKCLGCSECISSCNVENNLPVVGKDQVAMGREMHWMRIDRYYSGTPEEPIVSTQPMLCQHCDNAPCENVCPVNATNHSPDGLNQMAYNRCVGTRYCANNCPYKVRRFNFYNFRDHFEDAHYDNELTYLANNPEVTVRSRGVIEKCSFCIQNIMEVRETAIKEGREIRADEAQTACQSACPTDAIVFGDSNNENSTVTKHREHDLSYHVLEELNVRPNVTYLAKIRNTRTEDL